MLVTTGEALNALNAMQSLVAERMPVGTAMQIRRLVRELAPVAEDYNAERAKLIDLYAQKNGTGPKADEQGNILLADAPSFQAGHKELLSVTHEISVALTVAALTESGVAVAPSLLIGLGPLLME